MRSCNIRYRVIPSGRNCDMIRIVPSVSRMLGSPPPNQFPLSFSLPNDRPQSRMHCVPARQILRSRSFRVVEWPVHAVRIW